MFFQGLLGMILGMLVMIFRARIKDVIGDIGFAERYLGAGGTWTFLLLVGVLIFILSLMWALGTLQEFFFKAAGPMFGL